MIFPINMPNINGNANNNDIAEDDDEEEHNWERKMKSINMFLKFLIS